MAIASDITGLIGGTPLVRLNRLPSSSDVALRWLPSWFVLPHR